MILIILTSKAFYYLKLVNNFNPNYKGFTQLNQTKNSFSSKQILHIIVILNILKIYLHQNVIAITRKESAIKDQNDDEIQKNQKITSERELNSQKPGSICNDLLDRRNQQFTTLNQRKNIVLQNTYKQQQNFQIKSNKRLKSTNFGEQFIPSSSNFLKDQSKKFNLSNKGKAILFGDNQQLRRTPSVQKIQNLAQNNPAQSRTKLKRPSSVMNKSTRSTTFRSKNHKPIRVDDQKLMEEKIRATICKTFTYGIKLTKYVQENNMDLMKVQDEIFQEEIKILGLMNNCKHYLGLKFQNEEEQDAKLSAGVEKQIIEMLKKKKRKQLVITNCDKITDQISSLIESRLKALNQTVISQIKRS